MATDLALEPFTVEAFTFISLGILTIGLQAYAILRQVVFRNFEADDYLMLLVIMPYTIETALAKTSALRYLPIATNKDGVSWEKNGFSTVAGWAIYATVLLVIKSGLRPPPNRFVFIVTAHIAVMCSILFNCEPIPCFWQVYPDPGNLCEPASSKLYIFLNLSLNIATDTFLLIIPASMLWGGIVVTVAGLLRCLLITRNPKTGSQEGASWALLESFVAIVTSGQPMMWGWMRQKLRPLLGSLLSLDNKYKGGPEPGNIMLGDHSTPPNPVIGNESIIAGGSQGMFIHMGEASSDEIISSRNYGGGVTKGFEFSVLATKAQPCNSLSVVV
ncbi:hypothetical protein G7Z17_g1269 [Cylindrodendrum hubeiense]|uniref:Uncharacterized protein n=1 Tax=Cylindrodendrum hubeiense TaxID=595255 RepID=A0A9P5HLW7_9HYPO|nr:hypothetical protein G7Z17_g1269 [Cylindrodendrum hubeiense]